MPSIFRTIEQNNRDNHLARWSEGCGKAGLFISPEEILLILAIGKAAQDPNVKWTGVFESNDGLTRTVQDILNSLRK